MRWIGLKQLSEETGLTTRALQYIAAGEPGVLVTQQQGTGPVQYQQPACAINLRKREAEKQTRQLGEKLSDAKDRKTAAEAALAELDLAERRGELVTVADFDAALRRVLEPVRSRLSALPGRLAPQMVELPSAPVAQRKLQAGIAEVLEELQAHADQDLDEPEEGVA